MRKVVKRLSQCLLAMLVLVVAVIGYDFVTGNFHAITEGVAYRSAQPKGNDLENYVKEYGIKSVINLRGENPQDDWYRAEAADTERLGVKLINFRMKAARELTNEQANQLIEVMRNAPKPVLIHCHAGADRSGLASALYVAGVEKGSEWKADYQISLRYGHIPLWFTEAAAMRRTFERMEPSLGYGDS